MSEFSILYADAAKELCGCQADCKIALERLGRVVAGLGQTEKDRLLEMVDSAASSLASARRNISALPLQ
jgi:hypothetical protein